jgi:predicted 3-demethylubiquinone-9 3-methyltransferase (glyoxalase superfamily)
LWYDQQAKEAAKLYTSLFPDSEVSHITTLHDTPSGDTDLVSFKLWGYSFTAISAGPYFKFNPSISLIVNFDPLHNPDAKQQLDQIWNKLIEGGKALMPLDKYPYSELYGWVEDKYGLTWQLILTNPDGEERPPIIPSLLFVSNVSGKAQEATDFYLSIFKNSQRGAINYYPAGMEPDQEGTIMFTDFKLENQWFAAMDSARQHDFNFNEAVSLIVKCENQTEIDYFWEKLSAVPEAEQCGWLKDKYGVSWQIVPAEFDIMMSKGTQAQIDRMTQVFLPMKKFDLAALKKAYEG